MTLMAKISLCGDGGVGKTSLRKRYVGQGFDTDYLPTIGADFVSKQITLRRRFTIEKFIVVDGLKGLG